MGTICHRMLTTLFDGYNIQIMVKCLDTSHK